MKVSRFTVLSIFLLVLVLVFSVQAHANLELLGQGTSAEGRYNLIYDTDLDITWYDYSGYGNWQNRMDWAGGLSVTTTAGTYDDWRLPTTVDGPYVWGYDGTTTAGYNITNGEMGHLFHTELGNVAPVDTSGAPEEDWQHGLVYTSFFQNLVEAPYWTSTEYADNSINAWYFDTNYAQKYYNWKGDGSYAIAVMDGRAIVPEPISSTLFIAGGATLGFRRFKKRK